MGIVAAMAIVTMMVSVTAIVKIAEIAKPTRSQFLFRVGKAPALGVSSLPHRTLALHHLQPEISS
jgi:hypothetical protein